MSIQLAAQRIVEKKIPGAIAELGVYRGELAAILNRFFPDRTLYLGSLKADASLSTTITIADTRAFVVAVEEFIDATGVPRVQLRDFAGTTILPK